MSTYYWFKLKGFKRSCSRKDDFKKINPPVAAQETPVDASKITYSSINSPNMPKPYFGNNSKAAENQYGGSPNQRGYRKNTSFQNNYYNNSPNNNADNNNPTQSGSFRFQNKWQNQQFNGNTQQTGISLFIKANNVNEELLRSIFEANVSQVKVLSIDVKTK